MHTKFWGYILPSFLRTSNTACNFLIQYLKPVDVISNSGVVTGNSGDISTKNTSVSCPIVPCMNSPPRRFSNLWNSTFTQF